ncbi:MAG: phosphoglycerate kinase, partial [Planctomycetes bacterium]|nr:phosphoglycerate kinase [Planctomycetota bacterium]
PLRDGVVTDDTRVRASIETLQRLIDGGAKVIVASHLGRPKGKVDPSSSLRPVAQSLEEHLGHPVTFVDACLGKRVEEAIASLSDGGVLLLENLRFEAGEEQNHPDFARDLANLADVYVNDAFGTAHRAHASTEGMTAYLEESYAGSLLLSELEHLDIVRNPKRPLLCLLGGAKVSDKLAVLEALARHSDVLAVGGAMAYTFLASKGQPTGRSLVEAERIPDARKVIDSAESSGRKLLLPVDHRVVDEIDESAVPEVVDFIPDDKIAVDIGPQTARMYAEEASSAATVFWNGPMGIFEIPAFAEGTRTVARGVAESEARSIVGGGDSVAAINQLGLADQIGHLSTGGGASLQYVQGLALPGLTALDR